MKRLTIILVLLTLATVGCTHKNKSDVDVDLINNPCSAEGYNENVKMPVLSFDQNKHDFGRLTAGENIAYSFHFRNTGNADLIISNCSASCGCTVADYPTGRIAPGADGYITVSFRSAGKSGQQYQEVTVVANTQPARNKLIITAQVGM